jgi:hypothetical protein
MDPENIENIFVETFIVKGKRERSLIELKSKEKRRNFFNKLCHRYQDLIDMRWSIKIPVPNSDSTTIYDRLLKNGAGNNCYVMSYFQELDQEKLPIKEALIQCIGRGMPSIIICTPNELAYFEAEQESGPPPRFMLIKK